MATSRIGGFWHELRRRKVIRVAVVYIVVGWIVVEASSVILPQLLLPDWTQRLVLAFALLGFPIALVLAWAFELSPDGLHAETASVKPRRARPVPAAGDQKERSIAVLPMANMSGDPENEYFSDGISEEILNLLTKIPNARVASRTSSFAFKGQNKSVPEIAEALGVDLVLEGSVRRSENRVRITAQLIDAHSDTHLWSDVYECELKNIFRLQVEIAEQIVMATHPDQAHQFVCDGRTDSFQAYDYFLRGRRYFHMTGEGLNIAKQMFEKAIGVDPNYARAHAGLADTACMLAQWLDPSPENRALADSASRRALDLAPELAEAHVSRGSALALNRQYDAAATAFERAIELNPQLYEAWYLYGRSRFAEGKLDHAAKLWAKAHDVDTDEYQAVNLRVMALHKLGRMDEAREAAALAVEVTKRRLELHPDDLRALGLVPGSLIELGRVDEAIALIERGLKLAPDDTGMMHNAAATFAHAGHTDRALDLLEERLNRGHSIYRAWIENDSDFDSIRNNPRFSEILARMPQ